MVFVRTFRAGQGRLTVLALDLGNTGDVAGAEGVGWSGEEDEQNHAPEEGRHLGGRHGWWCCTVLVCDQLQTGGCRSAVDGAILLDDWQLEIEHTLEKAFLLWIPSMVKFLVMASTGTAQELC